MSKYLKNNFKLWLNVFTLAALTFLVVISWSQIKEAFSTLARLNAWVLVLIIPMQLIGFYAIAKFYRDFFSSQGNRVSTKEMMKVTLELNFINHVFPSGGVSGFSYLSIRLKSLGVVVSKSTLAQILRFALTFLTFIVILLFGMFVLSLGSETNPFVVLVSSTIIFITVAGTAVGIFIISKASRIKAFVSWLPKALNYISRLLRSNREIINIARVEAGLEDLHKDYKQLTKNMKMVKKLSVWAFIANVCEIITIYLVYIAFGEFINPGALIIAYAVANFAGLVAVLPGGVGIYEGLMTAVLVSGGVPRGLALSATVVFRILTMSIFLPVGFLFYQKALASSGNVNSKKKAK